MMCKIRLFLIVVTGFVLTGLGADRACAVSGITLQQWGQEATSQIRTDFRLSSGLYAQSLTQRFPAYAWAQGIHFSSLVAAAKVNPAAYLAEAESVANKMHSQYWCTSNGKSGYNASANNCGDRYYDDNAWIALALMELYEITGNTTYLNRAKAVVVFCMSGENGPGDTPNGGIRWHESSTCGANVCSTAPTCLANLMIYQVTGIQQYLVDGLRLYNWMRTSGVQDSVTGLYWQSINCSGRIDKGFLGYETAPPLQATIRLYQITGDASYLTEAQRLAAAMETHFVNGTNHNLTQSGKWCGHDMTNAMVELYEVDRNPRWLNVAAGYLEYLYTYCKDAYGRYPTDWYNTGGGSAELLDNASAMRSFWKMAQTPGGTAPTYPVMFFENCSYGGWSAGFGTGSYTLSQLKACGIGDNSISSAAIASGYQVVFYENDNFQGATLTKTANASCLSDNGWNDRASSLKITGCNPTGITPYLSVNGSDQAQTARASLDSGDAVTLSPEPVSGGMWSWIGPAGFSASSREITLSNIQFSQAGDYIATYTNSCGAQSYQVFTLSIVPAITMYQDCSYGGWSAKFCVGAYTAADIIAAGGKDNDTSSVRIEPGYRVTFYANDNFGGATLVKTADDTCFVDDGWNDRLSSMVIEEIAEPAGYWQMNEDNGLVANDSSTYNRNGTLLNMDNNNWILGRRCAGLSFDGVDDYVEITDFKGICGLRSRTCSAWVKTTASKDNPIITWGSPLAGQKWMFRMDPDGTLAVAVWGGYIKTQRKINDGRWHHVSAVLFDDYTPSVDEIALYIDGDVEISPYANNTQAVNTSSAANVLIGARIDGLSSKGFYTGLIDDVRIYNRALSAADIRDIYRADALIGDLSSDGVVDFADFSSIAQSWQKAGSCNGDVTCDCAVDMDDFMILADEWLMQIE